MNAKPPKYQKLSRKIFAPFVKTSLWKGPDHLLWVEKAMMQERYKRFDYKDIQAMITVKNNNQNLWSFIWGALAVLFGAVAFFVPGTPYASSILGGLCFLLLGINLFMGPCCQTYVKSAVQVEKLSSLVRLKKADKILTRIKELVEEKQGFLLPQNMILGQSTAKVPKQSQPDADRTINRNGDVSASEIKQINPFLHGSLFGLMSFMGIGKFLQYRLQSPVLSLLDIFSLGVLFVLAIAVIVRQGKKSDPKLLLVCDWLALALIVLQSITVYILFILTNFRNPEISGNTWVMIKEFLRIFNQGEPVITGLIFGFGLAGLAVGLSGLILLTRNKK